MPTNASRRPAAELFQNRQKIDQLKTEKPGKPLADALPAPAHAIGGHPDDAKQPVEEPTSDDMRRFADDQPVAEAPQPRSTCPAILTATFHAWVCESPTASRTCGAGAVHLPEAGAVRVAEGGFPQRPPEAMPEAMATVDGNGFEHGIRIARGRAPGKEKRRFRRPRPPRLPRSLPRW